MTTSYPVIAKRGPADCAVAALAMAFDLDYHEVLVAAAYVNPRAWRDGLSVQDMLDVMARFGKRCCWHISPALDESTTGVVWFVPLTKPDNHCVFVHHGLIFDPDHDPVRVSRIVDYLDTHPVHETVLLREI